MIRVDKCEAEKQKDEIWVGNVPSFDKCLDLIYAGIKFRKGTQAYDIHGEKIPQSYMLPLFIKKESHSKHEALMMAQLKKIRGF